MISAQTKELIKLMMKHQLSINISQIHKIMNDKHDYDIFCEAMSNFILDDYIRADWKAKIIIDPFGAKECEVTYFQLLINLYFWEFNFMYKIPITEDWIQNINKKFLMNYNKNVENLAKKIYEVCKAKKIDADECFTFYLPHLTENLVKFAELLSVIDAPTLDIVNIIEFCKRNSEFNRLLNTTLDDSKSFKTLENELKESGKKLHNIIMNDKKSCLYPFIESDCLNPQQLTQMFVAVGPRAGANNVVMNHVMRRSYLNGLQNVGDIIAEAEIASKALIYKKKFVGVSGYMSRETDLLAGNTRVDYNCKDCGTKHYVNFTVATKRHLEMIINKNIMMPNGKLHTVTENDTHLIGTTVKLRSLVYCAHPDSAHKKICVTCYGTPIDLKKRTAVGGLASIEIENPMSNAVMAVKHSTSTDTIEFNDKEMLKLFDMEEYKLILKRLPDTENISIIFDKEYIEDVMDRMDSDDFGDEDDEYDNDSEENGTITSKMIGSLKIVRRNSDPSIEEETSEYELSLDGSFLTLAEDMINPNMLKLIKMSVDSDEAILPLEKLKPGTAVFNIKYITKETSRYLRELKDIIERPKPLWYQNSADEAINDFANLIVEANIKNAEMIHLEPVIYNLMKDSNDLLRRPDFTQDHPQFVIVNLKTGIFKGDLFSALVFQEITKTMLDLDSYRKYGKGIHDAQFKSTTKHDFSYMKRALKKNGVI